jgi:hypothetical protein
MFGIFPASGIYAFSKNRQVAAGKWLEALLIKGFFVIRANTPTALLVPS